LKDPALQLTLLIAACFCGIVLAVTVGVFIAIPVAIIYVAYLLFTHLPHQRSNSTAHLLEQVNKAQWPTFEEFFDAFLDRLVHDDDQTVWPVTREICASVAALYSSENFEKMPVLVFPSGSIEEGRYRDRILSFQKRAADPQRAIQIFSNIVFEAISALKKELPPIAKDKRYLTSDSPEPPLSIPLIDVIPDISKTIDQLIAPFFKDQAIELDYFAALKRILTEKAETKTTNAREIVRARLADTTLDTIFEQRIPFDIPLSRMLEHTVLVAGSGHGKTQTLGALVSRFIQMDEPPSLVILDSTGALVRKIQRLALFNEKLRDKIVILDPEHESVPALNMFDVETPRMATYSAGVRESVETEIVSLFNYIFTSAQNDLTSRQGTVFSYVVRLVLSMPDSTINTLRQVLEDDPKGGFQNSKYKPFIERLDATAQDFFKNQYFELKGFREQIAQRVYSLVQVPAFQRMFSTSNKVDFFDELQNRGSIVLVNTSESLLKQDGSTLFGRYIIARTMASAFERASVPEERRRATLLIIDEAAPYFDDTFDKLLTRVRQFKLGVCVAFQHMEQASEKLRSAIASNTSVKMAGGLGYTDSRWLARDMETTPEFLKAQRRDNADPPKWTQLACYVRNYTPQAVSITVPFYALENMPRMTPPEHAALLERNRERVSSPTKPAPAPEPQPVSEPEAARAPEQATAQPEQAKPPEPPKASSRSRSAASKADEDAASNWQ
jgi:hypothetical protein